jgi:hypothetical protein
MVEETRPNTAIVSRLSNSPVLPHDYRETASEIRALTDQTDAEAEGR